jgi:uncharacterized cupredoxin-like copper-binding protein
MGTMKPLTLAAALLAAVMATACAPVRAGSDDGAGGAPSQAAVAVHYSRFAPEILSARAGTPITVTIHNGDPIDHEWIVGGPDVHARHRLGTEPVHAAVPTEVTIPAYATRTTTVTFAQPGDYAIICHLPGHEAYGMRGTLRVRSG